MGNYNLSEQAEADLIRIHQWGVRRHGELAADRYYYRLIERFELLAASPYLYPAVDDIKAGYRRSVCGAESIYYRIANDGVEIMAILRHQKLDDLG